MMRDYSPPFLSPDRPRSYLLAEVAEVALIIALVTEVALILLGWIMALPKVFFCATDPFTFLTIGALVWLKRRERRHETATRVARVLRGHA